MKFDFKPALEAARKLPWVESVSSNFKATFSAKTKGDIYLILSSKPDREVQIPLEDAIILKKFLNENI